MRRDARGFTLVELAVGLAIVALLLGMLVVPLSTQIEQRRISETEKQLDLIREALLGFAAATGRLPCPATPTVASTTAGAGTENKPGAACAIVAGIVPYATLGVREADAWGNRFSYRVTASFADDAAAGLLATFLLTEAGDITITNGAVSLYAALPAVVVSHGDNGLGAYRTDGTQVGGAAGHELENADADATFVSRTHAPDFDDLVAWVSPNVVKSRMVAANRLP